MFSFLNRNKTAGSQASNQLQHSAHSSMNNGQQQTQQQNHHKANKQINENGEQLVVNLEDAKKNLYDSIVLRRTDIVLSLLNEWFKVNTSSDENLKYFFNSNYCENGTTNPLLIAYRLKDKDLIRTLLNFGADPGLADLITKKSLIELIRNEKSTDPNHYNQMMQLLSGCFMQAIVQINIHSLNLFLSAGFELNIADKKNISLPDENSYLHWAVMYANEPVVRLLLENGANVNVQNKYGATALHECITKKNDNCKEDCLHMIETLLIYKADPISVKGTHGVFKDLSALDLAFNRYQNDPEMFNLMKDFLSEVSSSSSSIPNSPTSVLINADNTHKPLEKQKSSSSNLLINNTNINNNNLNDSISSNGSIGQTIADNSSVNNKSTNSHEFEQFQNWCNLNECDLKSLIWPHPQILTLLNESDEECFPLTNMKTQPMLIYFKPPHTYQYMDLINKLASAFSGMTFSCIHKPISSPHLAVTINKTLFQQENAYSILVSKSKVEICAADSVALQYAFFTFIQLCKIYSRNAIPSLKIIDYSSVKYRSVLIDFSQGFYLRYEKLLALLQMFTFFKINQVHFYVKFSSVPPASNKKQWYHFLHNWFGLMKFCEEVNLQIVPAIDITNDVAELIDVISQIKEYLDLFNDFKFVNIGPRLSSLMTCMENKNPFSLDSNQYMMLCSYLYHSGDPELCAELEKIDKYVLMEYGMKVGSNFELKSRKLNKSGQPFFYCVGSSNWNSLFGNPDGCLHNLYDALKRQQLDQPLGLLLCNFSGSINRNPVAFDLNSILMFAGCAWNSNVTLDETKKLLPSILLTHGLINDKDGELGLVMLELGHLETFLTRKAKNSEDFIDLPYDEGSIFTRLITNPDEIELDYFDKNIFRKVLFHLRSQQSKLKSILNNPVNPIFKEILVASEIAFHLLKFLILLYNTGTRQQQNLNKAVGLNVINIGLANLNKTLRTDLANKLLILREEYFEALKSVYYEESVEANFDYIYQSLIQKLLIDQDESNLVDLINPKFTIRDKHNHQATSPSIQSNYYIQTDDNQATANKK